MKILTIDESNYFVESSPMITAPPNNFETEIRHFVDCCNDMAECIPNAHQGSEIVRILNAIYESTETGREIIY